MDLDVSKFFKSHVINWRTPRRNADYDKETKLCYRCLEQPQGRGQRKSADLRNLEMSGVYKTKGKRKCLQTYALLYKAVSRGGTG